MTNLETVSLSSDLISAYESLNESEKELKDVQLIMHNVQESITLLNTYEQESIKVLNADQDLENLLRISRSASNEITILLLQASHPSQEGEMLCSFYILCMHTR